MRILFTAIALFICGSVFSQIYAPVVPTSYGSHFNRIKPDSALHMPEKDTLLKNTVDTSAQIFINRKDSLIWAYTKARGFFKIEQSMGTGVTSADTALMLLPYLRIADSTALNGYATQYDLTLLSTGGDLNTTLHLGNTSDTSILLTAAGAGDIGVQVENADGAGATIMVLDDVGLLSLATPTTSGIIFPPASGSHQYTMPSGDGTLALTSQLPTYPYTTLKYHTGYGTFGSLIDSVRAALSAGIDILYSGGVISADTTTGLTKLATQGDIDRAIVANIPTLQQVTTVGNTTTQGIYTDNGIGFQVLATIPGGSLKAGIGSFSDVGHLQLSNAATYTATVKPQAALGAFTTNYLPSTGNTTDTLATLYDVRAGGGAVTLSSVGGGLDIQTGGAGNIRTLYSSDFDVNTNLISIDYTNGQAASGSNKGFLTSANWTTFNNKQAPLTFAESVVKTNDSVYLKGEKAYPPSVNSIYGRDSLNNAGFFKAIRVNLENAVHHGLFRYDTTGTAVDGFGSLEAIPDTVLGGGITVGDTTKYLNFTTGVGSYAPEAGDSIVVHSQFADKIFTVVREEQTLHYDATSGYTVSSDTLFFHPPLSDNERVMIQLKDSTYAVQLSLQDNSETPVDFDFNATFSTVTESPANQWNLVTSAYAADTASHLAGNGFVQFEVQSDGLVVGFDDIVTNRYYDNGGSTVIWQYGFYVFSGTMYIVVNGQTAASPTSIGSVGSYTHIRMRRTGTTVKIQASVGGTSYSDIYTYSPSSTGNLWFKADQKVGSGSIINPKHYGF